MLQASLLPAHRFAKVKGRERNRALAGENSPTLQQRTRNSITICIQYHCYSVQFYFFEKTFILLGPPWRTNGIRPESGCLDNRCRSNTGKTRSIGLHER